MKKELIEEFIRFIGDDPAREGLQETPVKVLKSLEYCFSGYNIKNPEELISKIKITEKNNNIIIIKDIEFYSFCEHHILPITGKINIGYIANEYIAGIGSIIRVVSAITKRLQLQERIAAQTAKAIEKSLEPLGVIVHIKAKHMCLLHHNINNVSIVTIHNTGLFSNNNIKSEGGENYTKNSRTQEFLTMIGK